MNKKFSTLAAALLLAGSFSVNAQTTQADELTKGNVYYVQSSSSFTGVSSGSITTTTSSPSDDQSENYQWQVVSISYNGDDVYALKSVTTGKYFDGSSLSSTPVYGSFSRGSVTLNSTSVTVYEIDPITSTPTALNNNQGWKKGFALEFRSDDHKEVVDVEDNVFTTNVIKAYNAEAINEVACEDVNKGVTGTAEDKLQKSANLKGHVLLKVSGDWDGKALYDWEYVDGTQQWVLNKEVLAKFRSSKFIVMDKEVYSNFATNVNGGNTKGCKFITVTGAELVNKDGENDYDTDENTSVTHHIMNAVFKIQQDPTIPACANDLIISLPQTYVWEYDDTAKEYKYSLAKGDDDENVPAYVAYFEFEGKNYVASTNEIKEAIASHLTLKDNMLVAQKDWAGKVVNIVSTKNTSWTAESEEVLASYIDGTVPEGQWIVEGSADNKAGVFSFINRESDNKFTLEDEVSYTIYKTSTANKYEAVYDGGEKMKELVITDAPARASIFESYANLDETKFADQTYNISVVTDLYGQVYLAETGLAKTVELTADVEEAGAWKLTKWCANKDYEAGIETPDTIYHIHAGINFWNPNKRGGAGWDTYKDTLAMFAYTIQNEAGKYLIYSATKKAYEVNDLGKDETARENAPKFIFKEKHGKTNILALENVDFKASTDKSWQIEDDATNNYADKLFGAFSYNKVDKEENIYNVIDNDLFAIEVVSAPEYRRIAGMENIKIFKDDNNSDILFEHNDFLAMEHLSDFADMKAAMFADTAYVRYETRKPQYLLVVNPDQVIEADECEIPNHPHSQVDTLYGRFLVNLVDSAKAYDAKENKLANPYMWEGGYKLAFRAGKHTDDKLIMDATADTIQLGDNTNKIGAYAFRYVDRESESFIIETSLDGSDKAGYIKWLNGTPVVIAEIDKAEVFNLAATEEAPTANDAIAASEVSVVAVNGAVIVKNAAGKKVAISNILGQNIANAVLSSDNETIAAPAGIVVVAVEGEEAVKAVVK